MMKKVVILVCLFLLTGCTVNYKITIDEELKVNEEAVLSGTSEFYETYNKTTKNNVLKSILSNYEEILKENNYYYELITDANPYVKVSKNYNDINNYLNSSILFNDYFDKINYTREGNIIKIETEGFNPNDPDNPDRFYVRNLDISITSSYKVVNHNANKIDEKTNTFYYELKEDTKDFKIMLEIDTSSKFIKNLDKIIIVIVMAILIIVAWIFVFIINKKKKV